MGLFDDLIPSSTGLFDDLIPKKGAAVADALKNDQDYQPTPEEISSGYKARFSLPDPGAIWKGAKVLATETLPAQWRKSRQQIAENNTLGAALATAGETALRGTAYLGDMLKNPLDAAIGEAAAEAQSPGNAMLRAAQMALRVFNFPIPVSPRTPEQQRAAEQIWASRMRVAGEEARAMAPYHEGDQTFIPGALGAPAELASNFVDPTMAVPALKAAGLLKLAGKGAEAASMAGRIAKVAEEAANTGGVVKKAAEVAAPVLEKGSQLAGEGLGKVATGLDKVQPVLDIGGLVKGGLPGAAGAHIVGRTVRAGVKWASKVRDASTGLRNIAKADWNSTWTVAQQLAKDSDAPVWLRRAASSSVAPLVESTVRGAGAVGEGALHGAAIGGAASMVNDTLTPEERGEFIGGGAVLGGGGAALGKGLGAVTGRNAQARQAHDWAVMAHDAIQSGADPASVLGASDAVMSYAHSLKQLFKGAMPGGKDLTVRLMDGNQFAEAHPNEPTAVGSFVTSPDGTHEVRLNLDRPDADSRALHEGLGHALLESVVGNTPDAFERARAVFSPDEISTAAQQYAAALHPELKGADQQTWIAQQQANSALRWGDRDAWILSELLSEGAVQAAGGRSIRDMASPGFGSSLMRAIGRDKPFKVDTTSFFSGDVAAKLNSPELTDIVRGRVEQLGAFRPGIDEPKGNSVVIQKGDWGKKPFAPLHDLEKAPAQPPPLPRDPSQPPPLNPRPPTPAPQVPKGNDFVVVNPTTGAVVDRPPAQTRKLVRNRQKAVDAAVPRDVPPASPGDPDTQVKLRTSPSGLVERSGTTLGDWFYNGNVFSETTKGYARKIEEAIKSGSPLSGFYHEIGESAKGWAKSVGEKYGNLRAEYKDFIPVGFLVSTAGNLLVRNYSLTAFERKAQTWGARKGALSLELWNGDVGAFKSDVQTYLKNHSEGRPGADGIGEQKRNVINAFLVGGNRSFEAVNPLRPLARGADREGIIRSYRLDRLETVEPSEITGFSQPKYEQQLRNLSPKTEQFSPSVRDRVNEFEKDQQEFNSIPLGSTNLGHSFDRSFHLTKLVRRFFDGFNTQVMDRMIQGAEKRGDADAASRYRSKKQLLDRALPFAAGTISDLVASLPEMKGKDLRSGNEIDPFVVLKKHFPDGQRRPLEEVLGELSDVVQATRSPEEKYEKATAVSRFRDVANMAEVIRDFAPVDQKTVDKLFQSTWGKTEAQKNAAESEMMREVSNPEFNDVTKQGDATIIKRLPNNEQFSPRVPKDEREVILNLTSATGTLPGLDRLTREASGGDTKAEKTLNGITHDALQLLMSGVAGARVDIQDTRGVFGSSFEPAVQAVVRGTPESIDAALAAAERFAKNFNQQEIHRREAAPEGSYFGRTHDDGSFDTPVFAFTLKNELSPGDITRLIEASGLDAITQRGNTLEVYYAGDPTDQKRLLQFERSITALQNALGDGLQSYRTEAARLWRYGDGQNGTIPYERIRGDVRPEASQQNVIAKRIAERLRGKEVPGAPQAKEITPEQADLQTRIAKEFEAAPMNELDNPVVAKAYRELADELVTQYEHLPVKVEVLTGQGEPYKSSAEMRKDVAENNHLYIFGTTPDSFGPAGVDYKGHPLLEDSGFKDINGKPLLKNDLLRAVHDYYAHTMTPVEFGPKGEEAAWKNHMQMTKSPWARLALTTETRGQNSAVNFGKNAEHNRLNKKDTIFADQKVTVLDPEFSKIGDPEADAQIDAIAAQVRNRSQTQFSPQVHLEPTPEYLERTPGARVYAAKLVDGSPHKYVNILVAKKDTSVAKNALEGTPEKRDEFYQRLDSATKKVAQDPVRLSNPKGYVEYMRDAGVSGDVMAPPAILKTLIETPQKYVDLVMGGYHGDKTKPGSLEAAMSGLDSTLEMRKAIGEKPPALISALHHFWGILSRQATPLDQEGAWLRLISQPEVLDHIQKSIDGTFDLTDTEWDGVVSRGMKASAQSSNRIGNAVTSNANSFYLMLNRWNGKWDRVSDIYAAPSSIEMGRRFWAMGEGPVGIKNKVQRFVGLTFGTPGLIMDRWKFVEFYMGQFGKEPRDFFEYSATGTPGDPASLYAAYGGVESSNPVLSLAFYEGMETALGKAIENSAELKQLLGRHANVGGLHWVGWNAIKNEAVGHSSLNMTYDLARKTSDPKPQDVLELLEKNEYFTEGLSGNTLRRFSLKDKK